MKCGYKEIFQIFLIKKTNAEIIEAFCSIDTKPISKNELKEALSDLVDYLIDDDCHRATACALTLLRTNDESALWEMRKRGVFRISRYEFNSAAIVTGATLLDVVKVLEFSDKATRYLSSLAALHSLCDELKSIETAVLNEIAVRREVVLKSMLVIVDRLFLGNWQGGNIDLPGNDPLHHNVEEITEALSTIIAMFRKQFGLQSVDLIHVDAEGLISEHTYLALLIEVCRLNHFKRAETLIDGFPYEAIISKNDIIISSTDPVLEKSIRLGYTQQEIQFHTRKTKILKKYKENPKEFTSLQDITNQLFRSRLSNYIKIKEHPERRLVFDVPADHGLEILLSHYSPFFEEMFTLLQMDVDSFTDEVLWEDVVKENVRVVDIVRAQRLFAFISYIYHAALTSFKDKREQGLLIARSIICVFHKNDIQNLLSLAVPSEQIKSLIDILTLPEEGDYVDLQYQPLIKTGDTFVCSPLLLANSNLVRNVRVAHKLYRGWPTGKDPMLLRIRDALISAGFRAEIEVKFPFGRDLDGDIVALRDGVLFIFECKHAYHPCNVHELRNVFDHVIKGSEQLDIRLPLLKDFESINKLLKSLSWEDEKVVSIRGAIITATRVFHGWRPGDHIVIQAKELINVLERGVIATDTGYFHIWESNHFSVNDLVAYIDGSSLINDQFESMVSRTERHPFGSHTLVFDSWKFDEARHAECIKKQYRFTSPSQV